ncbi:hypothetical protein FHS16_002865 [Paenibacillus endophyticus]|uniref:DUF4179 domain-containing protein n=1 Tax=Paenibacillus endophyticus TaxID=1294268 RepID=A0A7W5C7Y4_9BACL|nr:DUF4179 domain-containing protein [Paenibacillus endophyticus]MBB3152808.1 hypothetical protein [Paenibacillus endophyticus]
MSIYTELNDSTIDVSEYEEMPLTDHQKKKWRNRVVKKIRNRKQQFRKYTGIAALFILAAGISLSMDRVTFADIPFVGAKIEGFLARNAHTDYTPFKTQVGQAAENAFGKWTLNEVLVDNGQLIISSTFEPAKGVKFHYKMHPQPTILMNGYALTRGSLQQSIKVNDAMFTIYNKMELQEIPVGETIQFHITFDNLDNNIISEGVPVDQPWVFDIQVPTEQLAATRQTIPLNQELSLGNGHFIRLKQMELSPISTILYYDWSEQANHIAFKLVAESGTEILPSEATIASDGSYNRFPPIDLKSEHYYLVPFESSVNPHADNPGEIPEQRIPINP